MKYFTSAGWGCRCDICGTDITFAQEQYADGLCRSCRIGYISRRLELLRAQGHGLGLQLWQDFPSKAHTPAEKPLMHKEIDGQMPLFD